MATRRERRLQKAEKLVQRGRLEAAIEELHAVLKESPDDTRTLNRVGDLYARLNRVDEAVELFSQAADRFSKEGFFVKAIAIFKKILRLDPTRMSIYESLAELYQLQGLTNEARGQYQVVADYYERAEQPKAVITVYRKLVELDPADVDARLRLADLLAEADQGADALDEYRASGTALLDRGKMDEALSVFLRAIDADASNLQFVMQTVLQLQAADRPQLVERFLSAAVERNPEAVKARELLASVADGEAPEEELEPVDAVEETIEQETTEQETVERETAEGEVLAGEPVDEAAAPEEPPAEDEASPAGLDEFEIELESFEDELSLKADAISAEEVVPEAAEDAAEAAAEEPPKEPAEEQAEELVAREAVEEEAVVPEPAHEPTVEEVLAEADALAGYGLDGKAVQRLERAIELAPGHLGAYRRLIGIQLNARRESEVIRLAAEAADAARESGDAESWRRIARELENRGFGVDGSTITPPVSPPVIAEVETPEELLVDAPREVEEVASASEETSEVAIGTVEPADGELDVDWLEEEQEEEAEPPSAEAPIEVEPPEEVGQPAGPSESVLAGDPEFFDLGAELEQELGGDGRSLAGAGDLEGQSVEEIVRGFKEGMAEVLSPEAYETHYNLGIAYREMGLVDEAIGEFQLAAKDPRYLVESCSLLGQCFQEKDFADLAIKWYRKGLDSAQVTEEESLGLLYEMGNLYLANGDYDAARDAFTEIYGNNSNFRDVVAKLEELRHGN